MAIVFAILMTFITCGALAALVLVVQRLPKSDYQEVDNLSTHILAAWERGHEYGRQSDADNPVTTLPVLPALRVAEPPESEPTPGPFGETAEAAEAAEIAKY